MFLNAFPKRFPIAPGFYFCMVCSKFNSHLSKTEKVKSRGNTFVSILQLGLQRDTVQPIKCEYNLYQLHAQTKRKNPCKQVRHVPKVTTAFSMPPTHSTSKFTVPKKQCILEFFSQTNNILNPSLGPQKK
jgi:hypothetical protein